MRNTLAVMIAVIGMIGWTGCRVDPSETQESQDGGTPIRVGVLHSLSGTMAISERSLVDATLLAIEEINEQGGLLGRTIEPLVVDGRSDWPVYAQEAERLIVKEEVCVVFGCWTSASRKMVKPVFEEHNHLLFYPVQYEGVEQSPNIVYTGAAPSQQIIPAVRWCFDNLGAKFFLVGSDYVFPRTANEIVREQLGVLHGELVGERYIPLGSIEVRDVIDEIIAAKPDVILNTINGDSNVAFFRELRSAGIGADVIPTMSFSLAEDELRNLALEGIAGDYACWNYFQSIDSKENRRFVQSFRDQYGSSRVTDDPIEAAYVGVHLWAQAVREVGTEDVQQVRGAVKNQKFRSPGGLVYVDPRNNHLWKTVRIGKARTDGQFEIVWSSERPVRPEAYPVYRTKAEWEQFLDGLYESWGQKWAK